MHLSGEQRIQIIPRTRDTGAGQFNLECPDRYMPSPFVEIDTDKDSFTFVQIGLIYNIVTTVFT